MGGACCSTNAKYTTVPQATALKGHPNDALKLKGSPFSESDKRQSRRASVQQIGKNNPAQEQNVSSNQKEDCVLDDFDAPPVLPSKIRATRGAQAPEHMSAVGGSWARCPACRTRHGPNDFCTGARRKSIVDGQFERKESYAPTKMVGAASETEAAPRLASRRHTIGGMGMHAAIDALATGDVTLAASITDELREGDREKERKAAEYSGAKANRDVKAKEKEREEKAHLQFRKAQAIAGGDKRRNSLPNILAALNEDEPRQTQKSGSVLAARYDMQEMNRANNADMPWYKLTSSTAKDDQGRRMSASLQAVHRRNSYGAIPMAHPRVLQRTNPCGLPTEASGPRMRRLSIHS